MKRVILIVALALCLVSPQVMAVPTIYIDDGSVHNVDYEIRATVYVDYRSPNKKGIAVKRE